MGDVQVRPTSRADKKVPICTKNLVSMCGAAPYFRAGLGHACPDGEESGFPGEVRVDFEEWSSAQSSQCCNSSGMGPAPAARGGPSLRPNGIWAASGFGRHGSEEQERHEVGTSA